MNIGEKAKGVPANPVMKEKYPVVVGYYDEQEWTFGENTFKTEFITVDGTQIDCDFIEPAGRREKETVLS